MHFKLGAVLPLLAISGLCEAGSARKRDTTGSGISLYAYGGLTNGAPVFYDHGMAYIGYKPMSSASTNITFTIDSANMTGMPWTISANQTDSSNSTTPFSGTPALYIVPTTDSFEQCGFVAQNTSMPTGADMVGFTWFGSFVAFMDNSSLNMAFWAIPTNSTGIWSLYWGTTPTDDNAVSVVLKNTPPVTS